MIGTLIGAGIGAVSSVIGAIKNKEKMDQARAKLQQELDYNKAWYDRRYNEDATQRADAQRVLTEAMERIKKQNQAAAGTAAVTGMSQEQLAAAKEAGQKLYSDVVSKIAAAGADRKDQIETQYMANKARLNEQQIADLKQQSANVAAAAQGVGQAAITAGNAYDQMNEQDKYMETLKEIFKKNPITKTT